MIEYQRKTLENGLRVIFHQDKSTPLATVNILYNVGAKDEDAELTGFAHLFEHLMFGGSKNIESFDTPLQMAGGECNAFTSNDLTNYYDILPAQNVETAFWLESDRMLQLAFTPKSLEVQRGVVVEEFKQRYLNQPYGDVWLNLRPLIYKKHPYRWATIGKEIKHIEEAKLDDVKKFFYQYYTPKNAILVVGGNLEFDEVMRLSEKWFGDIPEGTFNARELPKEPVQTEPRLMEIEREVPSDAVYMAFRMGGRKSPEHYIGDLVSDISTGSKSSRMYQRLITEKKLFTSISAYITGSVEEGLFLVSGHLAANVDFEEAEQEVFAMLDEIGKEPLKEQELTKVKNKHLTSRVFSEQSLLNRVMNIAFFENMGMLDQINDEHERYTAITADDIAGFAKNIFQENNRSILRVKAKK